jgi:hypothetical protein
MGEALEEVNRKIRSLAARVDPDDSTAWDDSSAWEFVCECGEVGCTERIGLPLVQYDELKSADAALLAPGHQLGRSA